MPLGSMSGRVGEARFPFSSQILFSIYRPRLTASSATCSKVCGTEVKRRRIPPLQRESELTRTPKRLACELFYLCSSVFIYWPIPFFGRERQAWAAPRRQIQLR